MRCFACLFVFALIVAVPAIGLGEIPLVPAQPDLQPFPPLGGPGPGPGPAPNGPVGEYKAPKADGAVVELLDEALDPLFPTLINDGGGEAGTITREDRDVFAGVEAARVTPMQKYRSNIPGWSFKIVENPKKAGEFRYIRFAWKKFGGSGLMIQFHDPAKSWAFRYFAGRNIQGWQPAMQVSTALPTEWEVVTRDMFKDWGACTITGVAFSPLDGTSALFDHMMLGRSVEDLDKATDAALGRVKDAKAPTGKDREALWTELIGTDRVKAATAQRTFLATATDHVGFIRDQLAKTAINKDLHAKIQKLLKDLDDDEFEVRHRATEELIKLGADAVDAVQALAKNPPNDEVSYRANLILQKLNGGGQAVSSGGRTVRAVRVLERAATADARELLKKMSEGEFGFDIVNDAKAALARTAKKP